MKLGYGWPIAKIGWLEMFKEPEVGWLLARGLGNKMVAAGGLLVINAGCRNARVKVSWLWHFYF
jgi:hypothetical protein